MVSIENQELRECKDTVEVKAVLGDDPIDYMADLESYLTDRTFEQISS